MGSGDKWADAITAIVDSGEFPLVIVDSITALIPKEHYERSFTDGAVVGVQARMVGMLTQRLTDLCKRRTVTTILINQFRMATVKIGLKDTFVKKSAGGESIGFFCHMRFWINKVAGLKGIVFSQDGKERRAGISAVELMKTRYSTPGLKTEFKIPFGDYEGDPINEFLQRVLKSVGFDKHLDRNIRFHRKEYQYLDTTTGEILVTSKDQREFIKLLQTVEPPVNKAKKDTSATAFEFFTGKLNMSQMVIDSILKAANEEPEEDVEYERPDFTDLEESGEFEDEGDGGDE
jgi:RecA/RadA recombinase